MRFELQNTECALVPPVWPTNRLPNTAVSLFSFMRGPGRVKTTSLLCNFQHKLQGLDPLIRSVSKVTTALSNVSSVFQMFSFFVVCSSTISKGFGFVVFFAILCTLITVLFQIWVRQNKAGYLHSFSGPLSIFICPVA